MTAPRPIVAVVYAEATAPVVRSQTPPLLRAWREAGRRVDAALFTSARALFVPSAIASHRRALAAFEDAAGCAPMRRTHLPRDRGLASLGGWLARTLRRRRLAQSVLLCRQPRATIVGVAARDALAARGEGPLRVVLDLRGLRDVEYLATLGRREEHLTEEERARLADYRAQEETACRRADAVLTVSRAMARHVATRHGVDPARIGRVPNNAEPVPRAEEWRAASRAELGVAEGALLVAYSGTLAAWQMPEASVRLFASLRRRRPDARLLFLTPDADAARAALAAEGVEGAIVRSARPGEAARLLCAADYGLVLREDSMVNVAACPVKFGEYLACGVRPVLTPHVGDQSDVCDRLGLGVVVGLRQVEEASQRLATDAARPGSVDAAGRAQRRAWALENISPPRTAARIAEFLDGLATAG